MLPKDTVLGKIEMLSTYEYYDCPRLFSCKNQYGQHFIALSIEDRQEVMLWFYAQISEERLAEIEANKIELYDVFKKAEKQFVFGVRTCGAKPDEVGIVICSDIPDKFLPDKGYFLNLTENKK